MRTTGPLNSQLPLLIGITTLTSVAFTLSLLALFYGTSTNSLGSSGILSFETTSINTTNASFNDGTPSIPSWIEAHYLSICYGKSFRASLFPDPHSSIGVCVRQPAGYTFNLEQALASNINTTQTSVANGSHTLHTKAPFRIIVMGIAFAGIALWSSIFSLGFLLCSPRQPWFILRVAYLATIPAVILLTISSATITSLGRKMTGDMLVDIGYGILVAVHGKMGWQFYVAAWLGAGFMWASFCFSLVGAFKIANTLKAQRLRDRSKARERI